MGEHKKLLVASALLAVFLIYLGPLLRFVPPALVLSKEFFFAKEQVRQEAGKTNILILGLGGPKNEPSGLTDTILFTSINNQSGKTLLLSIPRDIWLGQIRAKINTAYYYGNQVEGAGIEWSRKYTSEIVGQPIHYVVVISFDGFVKLIDFLGGVDVFVDRSFTDSEYPIPGRENDPCEGDTKTRCRYETVSFEKGWQHFDGASALKFARSRHADGDEGSDSARAGRQQKILLSIRDKVLSPSFLLNPRKVAQLLDLASRSIETDIPEAHWASLGHLAIRAKAADVKSEVILGSIDEKKKEGFIYHPPISAKFDKQWVFIPRADTWQPLQSWIECLLTSSGCQVEDYTREIKD